MWPLGNENECGSTSRGSTRRRGSGRSRPTTSLTVSAAAHGSTETPTTVSASAARRVVTPTATANSRTSATPSCGPSSRSISSAAPSSRGECIPLTSSTTAMSAAATPQAPDVITSPAATTATMPIPPAAAIPASRRTGRRARRDAGGAGRPPGDVTGGRRSSSVMYRGSSRLSQKPPSGGFEPTRASSIRCLGAFWDRLRQGRPHDDTSRTHRVGDQPTRVAAEQGPRGHVGLLGGQGALHHRGRDVRRLPERRSRPRPHGHQRGHDGAARRRSRVAVPDATVRALGLLAHGGAHQRRGDPADRHPHRLTRGEPSDLDRRLRRRARRAVRRLVLGRADAVGSRHHDPSPRGLLLGDDPGDVRLRHRRRRPPRRAARPRVPVVGVRLRGSHRPHRPGPPHLRPRRGGRLLGGLRTHPAVGRVPRRPPLAGPVRRRTRAGSDGDEPRLPRGDRRGGDGGDRGGTSRDPARTARLTPHLTSPHLTDPEERHHGLATERTPPPPADRAPRHGRLPDGLAADPGRCRLGTAAPTAGRHHSARRPRLARRGAPGDVVGRIARGAGRPQRPARDAHAAR
ncbi:hypothetical protein FRIGORI9N_180049 [Frigoribacterium sp. 9N]|nr:hypothetical protein FRIGORI9N_180049 [Frigoribacterium sp. 9N]